MVQSVFKSVKTSFSSIPFTGQGVSWEDFLPSLTHVIVESNRPHILLEVEYMMELLEPSWLCGEGRRRMDRQMMEQMDGWMK